MAKIRTLKCPACQKEFEYLFHPSDDPGPRFCPLCGHDSQAETNVVEFQAAVTAPHVLAGRAKAITQSADQGYRAMEASSEANMQAAAEHLGVSASELGDMKITNLHDNQRAGDVAAVMPDNETSRAIAAVPNILGNQGAEVGRFFADATPKTGPGARSGVKASTSLQSFHRQFAPGAVAAAQQGKF